MIRRNGGGLTDADADIKHHREDKRDLPLPSAAFFQEKGGKTYLHDDLCERPHDLIGNGQSVMKCNEG